MLPANLDQPVRLIALSSGGAADEVPSLPRQSGNDLFIRRHPAYPTTPDSKGAIASARRGKRSKLLYRCPSPSISRMGSKRQEIRRGPPTRAISGPIIPTASPHRRNHRLKLAAAHSRDRQMDIDLPIFFKGILQCSFNNHIPSDSSSI